MSYCLLHINKLKTTTAMNASMRHNYRKEEVPNADKKLTDQNEELIVLGKGYTYATAFEQKVREHDLKVKSNAVREFEVLMTYTGDAGEVDVEAWKKANVEWLRKTFGDDNIVSAVYHGDEHTPHIHAIVVPIVDGRLNATAITGNRQKLGQIQDSYADAMKQFGLERGTKGSPATHERIRAFYGALNQAAEKELPKPQPGEKVEDYYIRASESFTTAQLQYLGEKKELQRQGTRQLGENTARIKELEDRLRQLEVFREFGTKELKLIDKMSKVAWAVDNDYPGGKALLERMKDAVEFAEKQMPEQERDRYDSKEIE